MSESENPKKVSTNDLRGSKLDGGIIDTEKVQAYQIGNNTYNITVHEKSQSSNTSVPAFENDITLLQKQKNHAIKAIVKKEDHKFGGKLVTIQVDTYKHLPPKEVCVKLSISFGVPEVQIPNHNPLFSPLSRLNNKTIDIKYGIKNGELHLDLTNGKMSLNKCESIINKNNNWKGIPLGYSNSPIWEFSINNESISGNQPQILRGNLKNEVLGILELLDLKADYEINTYFQISVNRINIAIIDLDDGKNKKQKETKIGLLLKYLKSELENHVSKVVIRYEPASLS